ncbi:hypothetical protein E3N88_00331 [Mikania micrantha]|uniref:Uncharacterized protein n=1 Tax=Mikania micrantha TaxID=192012 RepID=A0A5N6PXR0_9ASTR|nr:hypothetical protein E3N88_00331 [Mikania micrantha]
MTASRVNERYAKLSIRSGIVTRWIDPSVGENVLEFSGEKGVNLERTLGVMIGWCKVEAVCWIEETMKEQRVVVGLVWDNDCRFKGWIGWYERCEESFPQKVVIDSWCERFYEETHALRIQHEGEKGEITTLISRFGRERPRKTQRDDRC